MFELDSTDLNTVTNAQLKEPIAFLWLVFYFLKVLKWNYVKVNKFDYCISSYSFRGNYSFFNLEIIANSNSCHNISNSYWIFAGETIQGMKHFKVGNYVRKYGKCKNCKKIRNCALKEMKQLQISPLWDWYLEFYMYLGTLSSILASSMFFNSLSNDNKSPT